MNAGAPFPLALFSTEVFQTNCLLPHSPDNIPYSPGERTYCIVTPVMVFELSPVPCPLRPVVQVLSLVLAKLDEARVPISLACYLCKSCRSLVTHLLIGIGQASY